MSAPPREMPIHVRCFDFVSWIVPLSHHFPRVHRHTVTRRLLDATLDLQEHLLEANEHRGRRRLDCLDAADAALGKLRVYLRLSQRWKWVNSGQYEHGARQLAEIGRLLGGWKRATASSVETSSGDRELT